MKGAQETHFDSGNVLRRLQEVLTTRPNGGAIPDFVRVLRASSDHYTWVGVYLVEGEKLVLAAYADDAATEHVTIPIGEGICGSAAKSGETIFVPDVSKDSRYLMCFPSTRSEIVVPIKARRGVIGEIDIDSDKLAAFTRADKELLEQAAEQLAHYLESLETTGPKTWSWTAASG